MTPADREHYATTGYVVLRGVVDPADLDALEGAFEHYANAYIAEPPDDPWLHTPEFAAWLGDLKPEIQAHLYEQMRGSRNLEFFGDLPELFESVGALVGYRSVKPKATRFRMDLPHDTRHLAVWHQDHAYVGGSTDTVTAWVPLQDTPWEMGPLLVAPGTHIAEFGHDPGPNGRRVCYPVDGVKLQALPLDRGDVLLFHSLLLHSGQVNLSDRVRYSVQVRYEPL